MDGILVINKPAGMTSFDVIAKLRKRFKQKKFGHAGTLDPDASGVLVVLAGKACRLLPFLSDSDKEYTASIALGAKTDTDDLSGNVLKTLPVNRDFNFAEVLKSFEGPQHQLVPMASAKKVNGKKLYEYLREGLEVPKVYSDVEIYEIEPVSEDDLSFHVHCSGGTYIRSICRDFGEKTQNAACMRSLIRTKANGFTIDQAQPLEAEEFTLYPMDAILDYPRIQAENPADIRNGKPLFLDTDHDRVLMMDQEELLAVYDRKKDRLFTCTRGLWS